MSGTIQNSSGWYELPPEQARFMLPPGLATQVVRFEVSKGDWALSDGPMSKADWMAMPTRSSHIDSSHREAAPEGTSYPGVIAIANAVKGMRAMTSLDISNQDDKHGGGGIGVEGAKYLAEALKDHL
jgi:hypothetical protein